MLASASIMETVIASRNLASSAPSRRSRAIRRPMCADRWSLGLCECAPVGDVLIHVRPFLSGRRLRHHAGPTPSASQDTGEQITGVGDVRPTSWGMSRPYPVRLLDERQALTNGPPQGGIDNSEFQVLLANPLRRRPRQGSAAPGVRILDEATLIPDPVTDIL